MGVKAFTLNLQNINHHVQRVGKEKAATAARTKLTKAVTFISAANHSFLLGQGGIGTSDQEGGHKVNCNHPLVRIETESFYKTKKGELARKAIIVGEYDQNKPLEYYIQKSRINTYGIHKIQLIPCGRCIACRIGHSSEWATRCSLEAKEHENNWFITLTYNDEALPEDGSLHPEHMRSFIMNLRNHYRREQHHEGIRYLLCGEYGAEENTGRPHYHLIIFNMPIPDLVFHGATMHHKAYYDSEYIKNIWRDTLNLDHNKEIIIDIQEYDWAAAAYVARYVTKKINGPAAEYVYEEGKLHPEFIRMSNRPGIGMNYLKEHMEEIYITDGIEMKNASGRIATTKIPKAFDRKISEIAPEFMEQIKEDRRQKAEMENDVKMSKTSLRMKEQMAIDERKLQDKLSVLKRNMEFTHT